MKKYLIGVPLGLVVLIVAAAFIVPPLFPWNSYKSDVADAVRAATGRELAIDGDIRVSLLPRVSFEASGIRFANVEGAAVEDMATVAEVSGTIALWPLLGRELVVERLLVGEPTVTLDVDKEGRPNWVFDPAAAPEETREPEAVTEEAEGPPVNDLRLGDVRVVGGALTYTDALSGQRVTVADLEIAATTETTDGVLRVDGSMMLNDEPVSLELVSGAPRVILGGERFPVKVALGAERLNLDYDGSVQQQPVPGLDGALAVTVGSVGELFAWLDRPLASGQPDPGPLAIEARFSADGPRVALTEARIEGTALDARASGSFDGSGDVTKIALDVESGVLDLDRYLPPPTETPAEPRAEDKRAREMKVSDRLAALPDTPFDLSPLRTTQADVRINIQGVKAVGYEIGAIRLAVALDGGVLAATVEEIALYGGKITGALGLDGSGDDLALDSKLDIAKVRVDRLAKAATGEAKVTGVASGSLSAKGRGANPRALAQSLSGRLAFDLGGVDVKDAPVGAISELKLTVDLPGLDQNPSLEGAVVYNKERVSFEASLDPVNRVLSGERFAVKAAVASRRVTLGYDGTVQQQPVPGLDGDFTLDVPSVGRLATWLGQPLAEGQPDPGPLRVQASFVADGPKVALKEARIQGEALRATARGSYDGSGEVAKIELDVESDTLDVDRYLPPPAPRESVVDKSAPTTEAERPDLLALIPDDPIDTSPLRKAEADVRISVKGVRAAGFEGGGVGLTATLKGAKLDATLSELALYGGGVSGRVALDGSGEALVVDADLALKTVDVAGLLAAASPEAPPAGGIASGSIRLKARGANPRRLVESLTGAIALEMTDVAAEGLPKGALPRLSADIALAGIEETPSVKMALVYKGEPLDAAVQAGPLRAMLAGDAFPLEVTVESAPATAAFSGTVQQQPVPGLNGDLKADVPSVGKLAAWVGQPLAPGQPDPGPLAITATFKSDGQKTALERATIEGKAIKATAQGSYDGDATPPLVTASINVEEADLNPYLPPEEPEKQAKKGAAAPALPAKGWSEEPFALEPLRQTNADLRITTGPVRYKDLVVEKSRIAARLESGVLTATVEELQLAKGAITAALTLDGSGDEALLDYKAKVTGVQAKPLLTALADIDWLSGTTEVAAEGRARGRNQKQIVETLNGDGSITFLNGAIEGFNLAATLRSAGSLGFNPDARQAQKTDFAELGGTYTIRDGVVENRDFKMLAPLVRVLGGGLVPMPPRTVDYLVEAKLVGTLQGQGGQEALAGLPIPIKVLGSWDKPSFRIDWASVFQQAALDPSRLTKMPEDLKKAAQGFGVALPIPGVGGAAEGGLGGLIKALPGAGGGDAQTPAPPSSGGVVEQLQKAITPAQPAPEQTQKQEKSAPSPADAVKGAIKGLFGN